MSLVFLKMLQGLFYQFQLGVQKSLFNSFQLLPAPPNKAETELRTVPGLLKMELKMEPETPIPLQ